MVRCWRWCYVGGVIWCIRLCGIGQSNLGCDPNNDLDLDFGYNIDLGCDFDFDLGCVIVP